MRQPRFARAGALFVLLAMACGGDETSPGPLTIQVVNDEFRPASLQVSSGATVSFVWGGGAQNHNVTPVSGLGLPASPGLPGTRNAPFRFDATFAAAGSYDFFCSAHGSATSGMRGTVTVVP